MTTQTVLLRDGTAGTFEESEKGPFLGCGDTVTVTLRGENGNFIEVTGEIDCFLE